jgi:hypothetical protein
VRRSVQPGQIRCATLVGQAAAEVHRSPDAAIAGQHPGRDHDVAEDHRRHGERRPAVDLESLQRLPVVRQEAHRQAAEADHGQGGQQDEVGRSLPGVVAAIVMREPTGERCLRPGLQPAAVSGFAADGFLEELANRPGPRHGVQDDDHDQEDAGDLVETRRADLVLVPVDDVPPTGGQEEQHEEVADRVEPPRGAGVTLNDSHV